MKTTFFIYSKWLLSLALLLWQGIALAQTPYIEWQKCLGGSGDDVAHSIQQTTDGGYIVGGSSRSNDGDLTVNHGYYDYWIVKLDSIGNLIWQKSLGGSGNDFVNSVQQTTDGGYIVAGQSMSMDGDVIGNHGGGDYWVIKLDVNGNLIWQKCFGGSSSEYCRDIKQTIDGGYIVTGSCSSNDGDVTVYNGLSDYWMVKLDADGNLSWQKSLWGGATNHAWSVGLTTDGGYIVAGWSESCGLGDSDYWIVKLDSSGNISWEKCLGGSYEENAFSIEQTTDEGYIVAGWSQSIDGDVTGNHGDWDYWIVKLDASGNLSWQKSLGGSDYEGTKTIHQTTDGGYIMAGWSHSIDGDISGNHGNDDSWIVKLGANGTLDWQKCFGGSDYDGATSIQQTTDGGYIVAGQSMSMDGDVIGNHGGGDYWIVKLANYGVGVEEASMVRDLNVSPNPVAGNSISLDYYLSAATEMEISIIDVLGNRVLCEEAGLESAGEHKRVIAVGGLVSGLYFLELRTVYGRETVRWVKE